MGKAIVIDGDFSVNNIGQVTIMEEPIPVTGLIITNKSSLPATLQNGQTFQLTVSLRPSDTTQRGISYTSDNDGLVTVSSSGLITAVGNGKAMVTVKSTVNAEIFDTIEVNAYKDVEAIWTLLLNPSTAEGVGGASPSVVDDKSNKTINLALAQSSRSSKKIYKSDGEQLASASQMSNVDVGTALGFTVATFKSNYSISGAVLDSFPYNSNNMLKGRGIGGYNSYLGVCAGFGVSGLPAGSYRMRVWSSTSRDASTKGVYSSDCGVLKVNGQAMTFPQMQFLNNATYVDFNISIGSDGLFTVTLENTDAFSNNYEYFVFNLIELTLLQ